MMMIVGYIVEKRPKGGDMWTKVNDYPCIDPMFTVSNLPENSEWEFRVMAVNTAGNSDPSLCSPAYKIKEKIGELSVTLCSLYFFIDMNIC